VFRTLGTVFRTMATMFRAMEPDGPHHGTGGPHSALICVIFGSPRSATRADQVATTP
jgi:hypothetical protein